MSSVMKSVKGGLIDKKLFSCCRAPKRLDLSVRHCVLMERQVISQRFYTYRRNIFETQIEVNISKCVFIFHRLAIKTISGLDENRGKRTNHRVGWKMSVEQSSWNLILDFPFVKLLQIYDGFWCREKGFLYDSYFWILYYAAIGKACRRQATQKPQIVKLWILCRQTLLPKVRLIFRQTTGSCKSICYYFDLLRHKVGNTFHHDRLMDNNIKNFHRL